MESEELLQHMDEDMVALEAAPQDTELLNRVFRALHSIKGTSGFFGFEPIVRLSHKAEDVLNALRHGESILSRSTMDALLRARDQLGAMLRDIHSGDFKEYAVDRLIAELESAAKPESPLRLGEILVADRVIDPLTLRAKLEEQAQSPEPRRLGDILLEQGLATQSQISEAVVRQRQMAEENTRNVSSQTMRVDVRKLDELINLVGELVLERNRLSQLSRDLTAGRVELDALDSALSQATARLSFVTEELQVAGLKTRMVPMETVFRKFPRLVRDVSHSLQKEVELTMHGQETEVDKTMVELIADPLVHLVRNSLDHGIERPEIREAKGKPRQGSIRLEAQQEGDQIVISITDDGTGIDPERVGRKAVEKGLLTKERLRTLNPREILDLVFLPGFSTAETVSDFSGRGVGMDVVRTNLRKLNGTIELASRPGCGTTVHLRLPLTLAILRVLLVQVGEDIYALPLRLVLETSRIEICDVHRMEGNDVVQLRGKTVPLLRLSNIFGVESAGKSSHCKAVVVGVGNKQAALLVDRLIGEESTVIRPLGSFLHTCSSLAGATISGDGLVRFVLDPAALLAAASFRAEESAHA